MKKLTKKMFLIGMLIGTITASFLINNYCRLNNINFDNLFENEDDLGIC